LKKNNTVKPEVTNTDYAYAFTMERHRSSANTAMTIAKMKDISGLFNTLNVLAENSPHGVDKQTVFSISLVGQKLCDRWSTTLLERDRGSHRDLFNMVQKSVFR
jgi:hypothetical protein